jgi:hypothetical protein
MTRRVRERRAVALALGLALAGLLAGCLNDIEDPATFKGTCLVPGASSAACQEQVTEKDCVGRPLGAFYIGRTCADLTGSSGAPDGGKK